MVTFGQIVDYAKKAKKYVQKSAVLDPLARIAIKSIPVVGEVLLEMWNKSAGSDGDKREQILATMDLIIKMNEENFEEFKIELKNNRGEIIKNQGLLNDILFKHDELLGEVKKISDNVDEGFKMTKENFEDLKKNQMLMFEKLGIKNTPMSADKKIEISDEVLDQLNENRIEEDRLSKELEQQNNKPVFDPDYTIKEANTYSYAKEYQKATVLYDLILKNDPKHVTALNNKGLALSNLGNYQEAIKWFDKVLEIDPKNGVILGNKGLAHYELGNHKEAIKWFDKVLEIDPKNVTYLDYKEHSQKKLKKFWKF